MKIYTGFGDKGKTALFGGDTVSKDHLRVQVYGDLDELNSWLGLLAAEENHPELKKMITEIQADIFSASSEIATPAESTREKFKTRITTGNCKKIEKWIDETESKLTPLQNFILPGGSPQAARYHIARTVCRRAERNLTTLVKQTDEYGEIIVFINRLSDLLFVLARMANKNAGQDDILWTP